MINSTDSQQQLVELRPTSRVTIMRYIGIHAALSTNCKWHGSSANDANSIKAKGSPALDLVTWSIHQRVAPR